MSPDARISVLPLWLLSVERSAGPRVQGFHKHLGILLGGRSGDSDRDASPGWRGTLTPLVEQKTLPGAGFL